jgi:hypothetical protein
VEGVSDEELERRRKRYKEDIADCYGTVVINCERPTVTQIEVSSVENARCGKSYRVDPGRVSVTMRFGVFSPRQTRVSAEAGVVRVVEANVPEGFDTEVAVRGSKEITDGAWQHAVKASARKSKELPISPRRSSRFEERTRSKARAATSPEGKKPTVSSRESGSKSPASRSGRRTCDAVWSTASGDMTVSATPAIGAWRTTMPFRAPTAPPV